MLDDKEAEAELDTLLKPCWLTLNCGMY